MISEVFNVDFLTYMRGLPDKFFELAVVDPPYGINVNHNMGRRKGDKKSDYKPAVWDNCSPDKEYFDHLIRISRNQIVWGANHFISKMPYDSSCWLAWDKTFSNDVSFAQFELAWTSFDSTCKKFTLHPSDLHRIHPTQKPVALYRWILENYAKTGDKIFDSHMGSQSSRIAAWQMGFDYYGCELDTDYFIEGNKRFEREKMKQQLFTPEQVRATQTKLL
jgi:site-specific DNA-methyltransferase (adenine-specific)